MVEYISGRDQMDSTTLKRRFDRITSLPTLPQVALKVNELLLDPKISVRRLSDIIMKDQSIVTNILKLVNSSFYGFPSKIDNLSRAILVLGFETLRNAILSVSITQTLKSMNGADNFSITDFWRHSIAVAVTSRQLSIRIPLEVPETCFVGGLIHDIGKVIISCYFKDEFKEIMSLREAGMSFLEAEKSILSLDHSKIGGYLAERWHLPENLSSAIKFHHDPERDSASMNLTSVVHAGDNIVNRIMHGYDSPALISLKPDQTKIVMNLIESAPDWFSEIQPEIESAYEFFQIIHP
jgi:putative nucleotidyltransferase with HDIG domain